MITNPQLPPKAGYVEVEVDGVRRYRNVETGYLLGEEPAPEPTAEDITLDLIADHEERICMLELNA